MSTKKKRRFTKEFRRDMVTLIKQEGYSRQETSLHLGVHESVFEQIILFCVLQKSIYSGLFPPPDQRFRQRSESNV